MAEDENVNSLPIDNELAERLGINVPEVPKCKMGPSFNQRRSKSASPSSARGKPNEIDSYVYVASGSSPVPGPAFFDLAPFFHMIPPGVIRFPLSAQQELYHEILAAGIKAYHHLLNHVVVYGSESSVDSSTSTPPECSPPTSLPAYAVARLANLEAELESLTMMERIDQAYESLTKSGNVRPCANVVSPEATPQIASNTLGLFACAALRRPPSRIVECEMAAAQESAAAQSDIDRQEFDSAHSDEYTPCEDGLVLLVCSAGFFNLAKLLFTARDSTDFVSEFDTTPLIEACAAGRLDIVQLLIDMNADVNALSTANYTPLMYAAAAGHEKVVEALIKTEKCDVNFRSENGHCALMEASSAGKLNIVKCLIEHGAQPIFLNMNAEFKESALTLAAYKGHLEVVEYLLNLESKCSEEELHTALMETSMDGHVEVAQLLLDAGAPVNLSNNESYESPLTLACCGGHDALARMLIEAGACIEEPNDESYTPLMEAAREGHLPVVSVLLESGADVNAQTEETGETALTVAACGGYTEVLEMLVSNGGDLELGANTPLMEAAQEGHVGTVVYILGASKDGSCPNIKSHADTALALAAENGHLDVVQVLFTWGADINLESDTRTPLMKSAKNGYTDIVLFFLNNKANVNFRATSLDATALSLACQSGHKEIVKLLLRFGADPNVELRDGVTCVLEAAKHGFVEIVELMLDHNGIYPRAQTKANAPTKTGQPVSKAVASRRKKTNSTVISKQPAFNESSSCAQNCKHKSDANKGCQQSNELARSYYTWLAHLYNMHIGLSNTENHVLTELPSDLDASQIAGRSDELQKLIMALQPSAVSTKTWQEKWNGDNLPSPLEVKAKRTQNGAQNQLPSKDAVKVNTKPSITTPVPTTSGNFLSKTYEAVKKNFVGIPLPSPPVSSTKAKLSTSDEMAPTDKAVEALNGDQPSTVPPSSKDTGECCAHGDTFKGPPDSNIPVNDSLQAIKSTVAKLMKENGDFIVNQITSTMSPDQRKMTRKKLQEMITEPKMDLDSLKSFFELLTEWTGIRNSNDAVLEQQTASLNETLKVLRPTVTSLPGGMVASVPHPGMMSSTSFSPHPPFPATTCSASNSSVSSTCSHRRTHSEGDDIDPPRTVNSPKTGFSVDKATESNNDTPLTLACSNGHKDMVSVLVARGANIEHRDKKGFTSLILAATGGHVGVVEALLSAGANIEAQSERTKDTALSLACSGGRKEVVELLLSRGANKEHRNVSDYTPLSLAASGGYVDIVSMLIMAGAEINSRTGSKLGISPLMLAAMNGHKEATRLLLEKGSDINAQIETNRNTALTLACFQGRTDVVRLLLHHHANVEHRAKTGLTPLMEAANGGYVEVGELLLNCSADPNTSPVPSSRDTALTIAADKGHDKFVEMLLQKGAAIDAKNKKGCTALWLACHGGHLDTVKVLMDYGADPNALDNRKVSPMMVAFRKGHVKVVTYIVTRVDQYPNDDEMRRYISNISSAAETASANEVDETIKNCKDCMGLIVSEKAAKQQQADRIAQELLQELESEKAEKLIKREKNQKKKEEKKAKKKKTESEFPSTKDIVESTTEPVVPKEVVPVVAEVAPSVIVSKEEPKPQILEDRVPCVISEDSVPKVIEKEEKSTPPISSRQKRQNTRRSRNDSGKAVAASSLVNDDVLPPVSLPKAVIPPSLPKSLPQNDEWVKASKKKQATKVRATTAGAAKDFYADDNGPFGGWKDVELSRRKTNTLVVCSSAIARVIGRGGQNINAIREATGASIEVEKQTARRDQLERQISIRGTVETVRNATQMINGLIIDSETAVSEIIWQVLRGNSSVASSSSESSRVCSVSEAKTTASISTPVHSSGPAKSVPGLATTTNVWQQRMAARQQHTHTEPKNVQQSKAPHGSSVKPESPKPLADKEQIPQPPLTPSPKCVVVSSCDASSAASPASTQKTATPPPTAMNPSEEELMKAPGYRPQLQIQGLANTMKPSMNTTSVQWMPLNGDGDSSTPVASVSGEFKSVVTHPSRPVERVEPAIATPIVSDSNITSILDEKLAQIWGTSADSQQNKESAWGSQLLLNNFSSMNISKPQPDWASPGVDLFGLPNEAALKVAPNVTTVAQSLHSSSDWLPMAKNSTSTISGSRPSSSATNYRSVASQPSQFKSSLSSAAPRPASSFGSMGQTTENNQLFNQLAAQLLTHQGSSNVPTTNGSSYYQPTSHGDPNSGFVNHSSGNVHKSYAATYQSASQEYESLNNLLTSYQSNHQLSNDFPNQPTGFSSSPSVARAMSHSRLPAGYAPPPGFGNVPPPMNNMAAMPPPMGPPPPPGVYNHMPFPPPHPNTGFAPFNSMNMKSGVSWNNTAKANGTLPPNWNGGWN